MKGSNTVAPTRSAADKSSRVSTYGPSRLPRERKDENGRERRNNKVEREEDRIEVVRLHRSDYRATIIAMSGRKEKKKKERRRKGKKGGNIRRLRELEFRNSANMDIVPSRSPRRVGKKFVRGRCENRDISQRVNRLECELERAVGS